MRFASQILTMSDRTSPVHVVAGTDFSEGARVAVETARAMAQRLSLDLLVVHVHDPADPEVPGPETERWLEASRIPGESVQHRYGRPWVELSRAAAGAAALVVGSHGRSGPQPIALGSTTVKLGLLAPCPLVVVNPVGGSGRLTPSP